MRGACLLRCAVLVACTLIMPAVASALPKNKEAMKHLEDGQRLYKDEKYEEAVESFKSGFEIEEDPAFLYAWAQTERQRGRCQVAMRLYKRFLETNPSELAAEYARDAIIKCIGTEADEPLPLEGEEGETRSPSGDTDEVSDPVEDQPRVDPVEDKVVRRVRPARRWHQDPLGGALVGVGAATTAAGVGLLVASAVEFRREPVDYGGYDAQLSRVRRLRLAGGVTLGAGGAVLLGGVIRWAVLGSRERRSKPSTVGVLYDGELTGLSWSGRF
jgi:hypothetical protein